jgi:hypothetical protein
MAKLTPKMLCPKPEQEGGVEQELESPIQPASIPSTWIPVVEQNNTVAYKTVLKEREISIRYGWMRRYRLFASGKVTFAKWHPTFRESKSE